MGRPRVTFDIMTILNSKSFFLKFAKRKFYPRAHTYIYTCTHTYIYTRTHTHTYTQKKGEKRKFNKPDLKCEMKKFFVGLKFCIFCGNINNAEKNIKIAWSKNFPKFYDWLLFNFKNFNLKRKFWRGLCRQMRLNFNSVSSK